MDEIQLVYPCPAGRVKYRGRKIKPSDGANVLSGGFFEV